MLGFFLNPTPNRIAPGWVFDFTFLPGISYTSARLEGHTLDKRLVPLAGLCVEQIGYALGRVLEAA